MRYAVWNNKGGVGKSFLTFAIASATAHRFLRTEGQRHRQVVVIDMCPQANVSEMILGGNGAGSQLLNKKIKDRKTVAGYFEERMDKSPHNALGTESSYFFRVSEMPRSKEDRKSSMPSNLHLIAGDPELELQITEINKYASNEIPEDAWIKVHRWVDDLAKTAENSLGKDTVFFIDCNPSFSVYTEIGLVASDRVIVPCTPDGSSSRAISNVGKLLYGYRLETKHQRLRFVSRMKEAGAAPPKLHLFIMNRATIYGGELATAFDAMAVQMRDRVREMHGSEGGVDMFSERDAEHIYQDMHLPDAHSVGVIMSHRGLPLHAVKPRTNYGIGAKGANVQCSAAQKKRYEEALESIINELDL